MARGPKGQKRPADTLTEDGRNAAAVALGRKGGMARAKTTTKAERVKIAKKGAKARWRKP
jgi:hypothetical protein